MKKVGFGEVARKKQKLVRWSVPQAKTQQQHLAMGQKWVPKKTLVNGKIDPSTCGFT